MEQFENLLKREMGLDAASIGSAAILRAVQQRQKACGLKNLDEYWERVVSSTSELQELIEAIVVPETWFFREPESFTALARLVVDEWPHGQPVLRVLSLPCATGEEPYSIAMALLDAGLAGAQFRIDAVDISARALAAARHAVYGRNSFRGKQLEFRDKYFTATTHGFHLNKTVRELVNFRQENLLDVGFLPGKELYDVIFCRNVLIYFDEQTQTRAVKTLERLLTPKGWLFTGPSEAPVLVRHEFVSMKLPLAFAFRKHGSEPADHAGRVMQHRTVRKSIPKAPVMVAPRVATVRAPVSAKPPLAKLPAVSLDEAAQLADQGHLEEAWKKCEEHSRQQGPSAKGFYLMGLVRDAADDPKQAEQLYRKALYLEPGHHEALVHLALLLERSGNAAGARVLHGRVRRSKEKVKSH